MEDQDIPAAVDGLQDASPDGGETSELLVAIIDPND
jgi:hypothetical protein